MGKHRLRSKGGPSGANLDPIELNLMPFIDIFSLLCTFLLFSAVFVTVGIHEVQIPFFTNAAPPPKKKEDDRELTLKVDLKVESVDFSMAYSKAPTNEKSYTYPRTPEGLGNLHQRLVQTRTEFPEADKVTLFVEDPITYDEIVAVLDEIKLLKEGDPPVPQSPAPNQVEADPAQGPVANYLYSKVVMGNVVL